MNLLAASALLASCDTKNAQSDFNYVDERFADVQMLRYEVPGFDQLSFNQKLLVYYLQEAALYGRDIIFDQNCAYNLRIRKMLETVYTEWQGDKSSDDFQALTTYLKRVWFSNGIHHDYGCQKFEPGFSEEFLKNALESVDIANLPLAEGQSLEDFCAEIFPVIFDPTVLPMRVNQKDGDDLILTSAENYYAPDVTQAEAEAFYNAMRNPADEHPVMYGLNSRLEKRDGRLFENKWTTSGLYGEALTQIVAWLERALPYAESDQQKLVINKLIEYYNTGDLRTFDEQSIAWVNDTEGTVDFTNGFIESYGDPLGLKAAWESIVNIKDLAATARTEKLSSNAQWFEDNSPTDARFKKSECKGISAKVIVAAILSGALYPSTAIGINLPNSNWIRKEHGSKSVTIANLTHAYSKASENSGMSDEFVIDDETRELIKKYGDICSDLHTDLHECLGHGSGKLLPQVTDDSLKAYGSTIEEGRADLFALYYLADPKLVELGLTPNAEAYKSEYYTYMMNGLMTQLVRINPGNNIEEAHMRNRAFVAHWVYEHGQADNVMQLEKRDGKTYLRINDYERMRSLISELLAEVQRIKSEGDFAAARNLVETYGVKVDATLHQEILDRYAKLNNCPYKGFINPRYELVKDDAGNITDVKVTYGEAYDEQMLRYSRDYATLPFVN